MADIQQFLIQSAHKEKAARERTRVQQREAIADYVADNAAFKLPLGKLQAEGGDM